MKKLTGKEFRAMRDLLELPIPDSKLDDGLVPYVHPGPDSPEVRYLQERRAALGGPAPARKVHAVALPEPSPKPFEALAKGSGSQEIATTMAFVRLVKDLMRDKETGRRWVPIVPDEARTFGMESSSPPPGSTPRSARPTTRSTAISSCTTRKRRTVRSSTRGSPRPVRWPTSPPPRRRTRPTASR
ncbi:hypothetical protein SANTM175S_03962 [Streptomyces antimycoticus]